MPDRDIEQALALMTSYPGIGAQREQFQPILGRTVTYLATSVYSDGLIVWTPIPDGMTAQDLGRRFVAAFIEGPRHV